MSVSVKKRALFGAAIAVGLLLAAEIALRLLGFTYQRSLSYMEFSFPRPHELHQIFEPDPELLWRLRPGYNFGQGFPPLNRQGFRGPDFPERPEPGTLRVACLGDSVTFGRPEADFPDLLGPLLDGPAAPTAMNFGVPGYSSFQGLRLLPRVLVRYRPRAVVILFGWNDHWLAKGFGDAEQKAASAPVATVLGPLRRLRLYQFLNHLAMHLALSTPRAPTLRVPPAAYRANLAAMIAECRRAGAVPVLATAPSAIGAGKVPAFLLELGFIARPEDLLTLHREYNRIVRELARETGAPLCDLDRAFEERGAAGLFADPGQDLIHPNAEGYRLMAGQLAATLRPVLAAPLP